MAAFAVGDLVQHRAGGPAMAIREIPTTPKGDYRCTWFKGASKEQAGFQAHELQAWTPPKP